VRLVRGNERLDSFLADSANASRVESILEGMKEDDRVYKIDLAMIRRAASLTQVELAEKLGVGQGAVSRVEGRDDMLLSTLLGYLHAAGATDVAMTVTVAGRRLEVPLGV
jgi:DNA-binding XRE family transcriptional regulator